MDQRRKAEAFRALHDTGCFVMPNPWDAGTAVFLETLGFKAVATTSAGFAFSRALPDSPDVIALEPMLAHIREICDATTLPVNADFQNGFADARDAVAKNVGACIATGVAGLSIEDNGDGTLYERSLAIERIRAAREAIDASGVPVVLTARCEAWLVHDPDAERIVFDRLPAYAEAGADCLYAPGVTDIDVIERLVKLVAPKPINVLASSPALTVRALADAGVRRISVGSALSRVAWTAFAHAARRIAEHGEFDAFDGLLPFAELNETFRRTAYRRTPPDRTE